MRPLQPSLLVTARDPRLGVDVAALSGWVKLLTAYGLAANRGLVCTSICFEAWCQSNGDTCPASDGCHMLGILALLI